MYDRSTVNRRRNVMSRTGAVGLPIAINTQRKRYNHCGASGRLLPSRGHHKTTSLPSARPAIDANTRLRVTIVHMHAGIELINRADTCQGRSASYLRRMRACDGYAKRRGSFTRPLENRPIQAPIKILALAPTILEILETGFRRGR